MKKLDYRIVSIVLKHYFCNVQDFNEDQIISYYNNLIDKVNEDCDIDWIELKNYIIWQPFESMMPMDVVDNMDSLYNEIEHLWNSRE